MRPLKTRFKGFIPIFSEICRIRKIGYFTLKPDFYKSQFISNFANRKTKRYGKHSKIRHDTESKQFLRI